MSKKVIYENSYKVITEQDDSQQLLTLINDDVDFLKRLMEVLNQALPLNSRNQVLRLLQQRVQQLEQVGRQKKQSAQKSPSSIDTRNQ